MEHQRQVSRMLDEEHVAGMELLGQVEQRMHQLSNQSVRDDPELASLLKRFVRYMTTDLTRHFGFEEGELFPRLAESGDADIVQLLGEEHAAMREVASELVPLSESAIKGTLDAEGWQALRRAALEMVERQVAHIQKEALAMLPMLDDVLDEETDQSLALSYAAA